MKDDFNIENITPKNTYATPLNFYDEVQKNVLSKTSKLEIISLDRKKNKIIYKNYAIAASLVLVFSLVGLWALNSTLEDVSFVENSTKIELLTKKENQLVEELNQEKQKSIIVTVTSKEMLEISEPETSKLEIEKIECSFPIPEKNQKPKEKEVLVSLETHRNDLSVLKTEEVNEEMVFKELRDEELAELSQNMENDIYLELYN